MYMLTVAPVHLDIMPCDFMPIVLFMRMNPSDGFNVSLFVLCGHCLLPVNHFSSKNKIKNTMIFPYIENMQCHDFRPLLNFVCVDS